MAHTWHGSAVAREGIGWVGTRASQFSMMAAVTASLAVLSAAVCTPRNRGRVHRYLASFGKKHASRFAARDLA